jgi:hypothetical protein
VADMQQVEHAVREYDDVPRAALPLNKCRRRLEAENCHPFKRYLKRTLGEKDQRCFGRKMPTSDVLDFTRNV